MDMSLFIWIGLFSFQYVIKIIWLSCVMNETIHAYLWCDTILYWLSIRKINKNAYTSDAYMHCGATRSDESCHKKGMYALDIHASFFPVNVHSISIHIEWCHTTSMLVWCHTHQESGCVWHDSWMCVAWLMNMCDMTHEFFHLTHFESTHIKSQGCAWHDSWMCVTWRMGMCDMTHGCVWDDSCICVTWLIDSATSHTSNPHTSRVKEVCDMTHGCVWHDSWSVLHHTPRIHTHQGSRKCVTWLMHMCDMTHRFCHLIHLESTHIKGHGSVWHDSCICVTWLIDSATSYTSNPHTSSLNLPLTRPTRHFTCMNESHHTWKMSYVKHTGRNVTSHVWMSHITHGKWATSKVQADASLRSMNQSYHTWKMSYVKRKGRHVTSHVCISHFTHGKWAMWNVQADTSLHMYEWVISHIQNELCMDV